MNKNKKNAQGEVAFDEYYSSLFGERWEKIKNALSGEPLYYEYNEKLNKSYFLDQGSVRAAFSLPLENAKNILDMCAAPGGKSLILASRMNENAQLTCNERSRERKSRLLRVLDEHLNEDLRSRVTVSGYDAAKWCTYQKEVFDCILLDAPCSSERHVLSDKKYLELWTPARVRNLASTQWSILSSAFLVLKAGGYLLYSTCAIANSENDGVVQKLLKKYSNASIIQLEEKPYKDLCGAEKTKYGLHVLPDVQNGAGPLYFSLIHKEKPKEDLEV